MGDAVTRGEEEQLRMKFRSLTFTAPKRQQRFDGVVQDDKDSQNHRSYDMWKRLNPGYFDSDYTTSTREATTCDVRDFQGVNKETFRRRDRHTEYVEYAVRDKALARKGS
jgi:hypothetical protein